MKGITKDTMDWLMRAVRASCSCLARASYAYAKSSEVLGFAPSTVSKHLSILRQARLINSRKEGRWNYYRIAGDDAPTEVKWAMRWVFDFIADDIRIREDLRRLEDALKIDKEMLCTQINQS